MVSCSSASVINGLLIVIALQNLSLFLNKGTVMVGLH